MVGVLGAGSGVSTRALVFFFVEDPLVIPRVVEGNASVTGLGNGSWAVGVIGGGSCPGHAP